MTGCQRIDLRKIKKTFFYKQMSQGSKGFIAKMCKVHMQYGNSTTKWRFYKLIPLYTNPFSMHIMQMYHKFQLLQSIIIKYH